MNRRVGWLSVSAGLILCLGLSPIARAGSGVISGGKLDLSVVFAYRESDIASWKPLFEEASRLLWNATNGQLQIGRIRIGDCGLDKDGADIWILDGHSGAFANILGLGGDGHIYLSQTHKSVVQPALGQFGLVHEFGHYGFGVYDEYKGYQPPPLFAKAGDGGDPAEQVNRSEANQFCVTEDDPVACIMDGGTTISPNNLRTEFCTGSHGALATHHNEGFEQDGVLYVNAQQGILGESCWETIARIASLAVPDSVDTTVPAGLEPIDWEVVPGVSRVAVCVDRSASMFARPERIGLAREAAEILVDFLHERKTIDLDGEPVTLPGEEVGVVAFAQNAEDAFAMREILGEATKDSARAAIEAIDRVLSPTQLATDIGKALQAGLDQLASRGEVPACSEAILLLSDGGENQGADPLGLLPALRARGARVYSVALGVEAEESLLQALADSTGGRLYRVAAAEEVADIAAEIAADVRTVGTVFDGGGETNGQDESIPILLDSFAEEVTFVLSWDEATLDMALTTPSGERIDVESAEFREDVEAAREDGLIYIRVSHPEAGTWQATVSPLGNPDPIPFGLVVTDENRTIAITATTDQAVYGPATPMNLQVEVTAEVPVAGAEVTAVVDRPAGEPVPLTLYDDGDAAHGDTWANDGVYHTFFADYTADGVYTFHVRVVNENGTGPDPDLPFVEEGPGPPPSVPPFVRETEVSARVEGLTDVLQGTLDFNPKSLNVGNRNGHATCYVELPLPHLAEQIDVSSVRLNGLLAPAAEPTAIGDQDGDGITDLMLKFGRGAVIDILPTGMNVSVRLSGTLITGELFGAGTTIRVFEPSGELPVTVDPDTLATGEVARLSWPAVPDEPVTYSGYVSTDGGIVWREIFGPLAGMTEFLWTVDVAPSEGVQVLVEVDSPEGVLLQGASLPFVVRDATTAVGETPTATRFVGAQPNPSRGGSRLHYELARAAEVRLEIYDVAGRLVRRLVAGEQPAGIHAVAWNGTDVQGRPVASGLYLYVFRAAGVRASGRLMLLR